MTKLLPQLASVEHFPLAQQALLKTLINAQGFSAHLSAGQVTELLTLADVNDPTEQLLRNLIPLAQTYSITPVSQFKVGAVVLAASGAIYFGANLEFSQQALGQTVHAEQAAISNAWHHGETRLIKLAVSATPCGHCRQFINELAQADQIQVYLPDNQQQQFDTLLPLSFGPKDLGVNEHLMNSLPHQLQASTVNTLQQQAIAGANASYSPYSRSPSAVALQTSRGIYVGRYAENCAYNPSLSPLQSALIALHFSHDKISDIIAATLVESSSAQVSQRFVTKNLLSQLGNAPLSHYSY